MGKLDFCGVKSDKEQKISKKLLLISTISIIIIILIAVIWLKTPVVYAQQSGSSQIVIEVESGRVLSSYNKDMRLEMASTTKIATAIVAIENSDVNDIVDITKEMVGIEGSSIYLKEGERWKLIDLLYGLMLQSGNDAATAIAIHVGGSIKGFVDLMNEFANKLKAEDKHHIEKIDNLSEIALTMVNNALLSFVKNDQKLAAETIENDKIVDKGYYDLVETLISLTENNKVSAAFACYSVLMVKYIERIADHAVNIAEWVIYILSGYHKDKRIF